MKTSILACLACVLVLCAEAAQDGPARKAPEAEGAKDQPKPRTAHERFWGAESYVPDWRKAEGIDEKATAHFLEHYWPKFKGEYEKGGSGAPEGLSTEQQAAGAVVFTKAYFKPVNPDVLPKAEACAFETVSIFAAQGESEPVIVCVRTLEQAKAISIHVSDLAMGEARIAKEAVTHRLMLPYVAKTYAGGGKYKNEMRQMALLKPPDGTWNFPPNYTMAYAVDVHVPKDAKPGLYKGTVEVKAGEQTAKKFVLEVDVLPFVLRTNNFHAGGFGTTHDIWAGGFTGYYPEMIEMDSRYGFNLAGGFFNKGNEIPFRRNAEGKLEADPEHPKFKKFDATMQEMKAHGMGDVAFWNWGASGNVEQFNNVLAAAGIKGGIETEAGKKGFAEVCRAIKDAEKKYGWPELVINPYDEALDDQNATRQIIQGARLVHEASPETRLYMTEWHDTYTRLYQSSGKTLKGKSRPRDAEYKALVASGEKPQFNFHVIGANRLSAEARTLQDELGGEYWHYTMINRIDPQARFAYGFKPWAVKAEACLIWATYKGDLEGSGWTLHYLMPLDPKGRENKNTRGPVLASVRAIPAREGIDDRKYIETLRYHAKEQGSEDDLKFLDELTARCRTLLSNAGEIGGVANVEAKVTDESAFQQIRAELKERIVKLLRK